MVKAIFLDRDGVINLDKGYVHKKEDFELYPNTIEALKLLQDSGYILLVITNQSGIGRGYYNEEDFQNLKKHMTGLFSNGGVRISGIYHCPHDPDEGCSCRKPGIKLVKEAEKKFNVRLDESYVIGDKTSDIEMGRRAGCRTILVLTGKGGKDGRYGARPDFTAKDLYAAAELIMGNEHDRK